MAIGVSRLIVCLSTLVLSVLLPLNSYSATERETAPDKLLTRPTGNPLSPPPLLSQNPPVLMGIYTRGYVGDAQILERELQPVDAWAGKQHSLVGFFMDIQDENPAYNIGHRLQVLRESGYTAFINLKTVHTMADIANGKFDDDLQRVAIAFAHWSGQGAKQMAFIAPFPEMNIPGESYSLDPEHFKLAYQRIQRIFAMAGVPSSAMRWVFAPNGFSFTRKDDFEHYFPTHDRVDVVAFSGYNWGYCNAPANQSQHWESPAAVYGAYLNRLQKLAPDRPIFIAQTAVSSSSNPTTADHGRAKNIWLRDTYAYLAAMPGVQGILYFNIQKECDWQLNPSSEGASNGYPAAVGSSRFSYVLPDDIGSVILPAHLPAQ